MSTQGRPGWYRPDNGLAARMLLTMFLLGAVYVVFALVLVSQGVVQTFGPYAKVTVVQPSDYDEWAQIASPEWFSMHRTVSLLTQAVVWSSWSI